MKNISVIGAGTMGNGIAHVLALNGYSVSLVDLSEKALETALYIIKKNMERQEKKGLIDTEKVAETLLAITPVTTLDQGVKNADLVIEAATENISIKLDIFKKLDTVTRKDTILASNTSSISITKIAAVTSRPHKVIGMHFMNPVPIMKLVEVIRGYNTDQDTCKQVTDLTTTLGKIPIMVNDYPGFVANRILMPMINEAIYTLYEGVAGVSEIDEIMKLGVAHPMGPLRLADFIGLDVCMAIMHVLHEGLGNKSYAPCPLLVNMVQAGHHGVKTGNGFYRYIKGSKECVVADRFADNER